MKVHHNCLDLQKSALLSQSRQRYIPTFVHQQIFNYQPAGQPLTRCTPTYHSTVLNTDGYNIQTHHKKTQIERPQTGGHTSVYRNSSHQKRVQDLNPHNHACSSSRQSWYDNTKKQIIDQVKQNQSSHGGYSRCRKIIDLSSDPVFTQYNYGRQNRLDSKQQTLGATLVQEHYCKRQNLQRQASKCCQNSCKYLNCSQNCKCCVRQQQQQKKTQQKQLPKDTIINKLQKPQQRQVSTQQPESSQKIVNKKKDFHKNCVPVANLQHELKLKGKQIPKKIVQTKKQTGLQKHVPTFTVVRKNRIGNNK